MPHIIYHPDKSVGAFNVVEYCPFCDNDIPVLFDLNDEGNLKATCPVCGRTLMLCTMCPARSQCNYSDATGCRYNIRIEDHIMKALANFMDDDKRESVHAELAPCSHEEFLRRYLELDPEFVGILRDFNIELDCDPFTEYRQHLHDPISENENAWAAYCKYLHEWADSHSNKAFEGCCPVCYDEFLECEYGKE